MNIEEFVSRRTGGPPQDDHAPRAPRSPEGDAALYTGMFSDAGPAAAAAQAAGAEGTMERPGPLAMADTGELMEARRRASARAMRFCRDPKNLGAVRRRIREAYLDGREERIADADFQRIVEEVILDAHENLSVEEYDQVLEYMDLHVRAERGILDPYLKSEDVSEIMVNGREKIFIETGKGIVRCGESFESTEELEEYIRRIAAGVHREINEMNPILDARLPDGSRVNAVYRNVAADGPVLTIRKFGQRRMTADDLVRTGSMTQECAEALKILTACGCSIFISGGTSSGKTTFLNALTDYIPRQERVIVIEDSRELMMEQIPNLVQMECRQANSAGKGVVSMADLIRTSLRMRPSRIIVGEVRGAEAALMLQALNTGHSGLSTGHGNSVSGMLRRLEAMCLMNANVPIDAIRCQIVEALDVMVHLTRLPDGRRVVSEVEEIVGVEAHEYNLNPLFLYEPDTGLRATGNRLMRRQKLLQGGYGHEGLL